MKRTRKTEHPIAAAQRLGEQFHRWQGAGLRKAVRLVMRRNPTPPRGFAEPGFSGWYVVGPDDRQVGGPWTYERSGNAYGLATDLNNMSAHTGPYRVVYLAEVAPVAPKRMGDRRAKRNPAGWRHTEASVAVRRATRTGTLTDRQAAHTALARLSQTRKVSHLPNPRRRNPADPIATKVTALRRAIRTLRRYPLAM